MPLKILKKIPAIAALLLFSLQAHAINFTLNFGGVETFNPTFGGTSNIGSFTDASFNLDVGDTSILGFSNSAHPTIFPLQYQRVGAGEPFVTGNELTTRSLSISITDNDNSETITESVDVNWRVQAQLSGINQNELINATLGLVSPVVFNFSVGDLFINAMTGFAQIVNSNPGDTAVDSAFTMNYSLLESTVSDVPEPGTLALLAVGLIGVSMRRLKFS